MLLVIMMMLFLTTPFNCSSVSSLLFSSVTVWWYLFLWTFYFTSSIVLYHQLFACGVNYTSFTNFNFSNLTHFLPMMVIKMSLIDISTLIFLMSLILMLFLIPKIPPRVSILILLSILKSCVDTVYDSSGVTSITILSFWFFSFRFSHFHWFYMLLCEWFIKVGCFTSFVYFTA